MPDERVLEDNEYKQVSELEDEGIRGGFELTDAVKRSAGEPGVTTPVDVSSLFLAFRYQEDEVHGGLQ